MTAFLMLIIVKWWGGRWSSALPLRRSRKNLRYSTHNAYCNGFSFHSVSGVVRVQRHGSRLSRQSGQHVTYPRIASDQSTFPGCDPRAWNTLLRILRYSFQLRDTTTSRPCMPCHGARLRSPASPDYFDLTSRISVRHCPPESGSFDRSALELRAQRSSSPFCTFARPPPIGTMVRTVMVVVNSFV